MSEADLRPLSQSYPPPCPGRRGRCSSRGPGRPWRPEIIRHSAGRTGRPVPIQPPASRPVFVAGTAAAPGAATIPLGEASPHLLAVEGRVGRGRITMLTINPTDPRSRRGRGSIRWSGAWSCAGPRRAASGPAATDSYGFPSPGAATPGGPRPVLVPDHQPGRRVPRASCLRSRAAQAARTAAPAGQVRAAATVAADRRPGSMPADQEETA